MWATSHRRCHCQLVVVDVVFVCSTLPISTSKVRTFVEDCVRPNFAFVRSTLAFTYATWWQRNIETRAKNKNWRSRLSDSNDIVLIFSCCCWCRLLWFLVWTWSTCWIELMTTHLANKYVHGKATNLTHVARIRLAGNIHTHILPLTISLTLNINCPMSEILSFADPDARLKQWR